jgi:hypothetical protein
MKGNPKSFSNRRAIAENRSAHPHLRLVTVHAVPALPPVVIETAQSERLEIVEKPCPARCFVAPYPDYGGR